MNTISKEFSILPGVIGSCVSGPDNAVFLSDLPDFFTSTMVEETSSSIGRMLQMARVKGLAPQTMSIRYDKFDIIGAPMSSDTILLILCDPGSNTALISTTAQMLAPEIERFITQAPPSAPKPRVEYTQDPTTEEDPNFLDKQTSSALTQIKQALFDTVGPIADMVYDDCLDRWTANNPPSVSRIFELIGCISSEIDNPDLFEEFKEKISALL